MSDEMQKKYVEFQVLQQQLQQLYQQIQQIDTQLTELNNVVVSLDDFKLLKKGSEMLVPLASGIFAYAELKQAEMVRVNVGSNVSVKKSIGDTVNLVKAQIKELDDYKTKLVANFTHVNEYVHMLQHELIKQSKKEETEQKAEE
ncbi:prefoldin subunit alpha [Candidatus Woesearchaeota archaeon]|nr:prefoldin subunit alpha [Candidatus Woesearchaeota archaeon]